MTAAIEWAEKYRPRTLTDIVGNKKSVHDFRSWAEEWLEGIPEKKAVVLYGPAGIGKTSSAHALARDFGWEAIELNASDQRTAGVIEKVAGSASSMTSLFGGKRLIILDEADNIHGSADRGGMRAISGIIKNTRQPIVLIANDLYGLTPTIRNLCLEIKFQNVQSRSIAPALKRVCDGEGIRCSPEAVQKIAENAGGDLRSAVNDLQAAASGREIVEAEDISTGERDVKENIFKAMQKIFKSTDPKKALEATYGLDESPEDLVHWIDENLPVQYAGEGGELEDIRTGYRYLSKADLYLGRVKKRQNYRMWRYASMLMVCGTSLAKSKPYRGFIKYQQPSVWRRLGQTRATRNMRDNIASKIGEHCQESMHYSRGNLLGLYSRMANDETYAVDVTAGLGLELEELMYLTGSKKASKKLQKIYDQARELQAASGSGEEPEFFKSPASAGNSKKASESDPSGNKQKALVPGLSGNKQKTPGFFAETEISGKEAVSSESTETTDSIDSIDSIEKTAPASSDRKQRTLDFGFDGVEDCVQENAPEVAPESEGNSDKKGSEELSEVSAEVPVEEPVEMAAEMPVEVPVKKDPVEVPVEEPAEFPAGASEEEQLPSDPVSSDGAVEPAEEPKKPEKKTQKTLFDF